jgi:hypothetical protein
MTAVIFLGPSLPVREARTILDAIYLPPVRQADLVSALTTYRPDVIGLIDGEFSQSLAVWHKEILHALAQGVPVYGASSMGALRAAETAAYGMVGVGEVYRMFASGELTDDDEVALAHGRDEEGYRGLSEPMVNIRVTLRRARDEGVIDAALCDRLTALAKALFYPERSYGRVLRAAADAGVPAAPLARLRAWLPAHRVDVKREDAIALLETVRDLPRPVAPPHLPHPVERAPVFDTLYFRDRTARHDGTDVSLATIANYAALHLPKFNELNVHALNRALVPVLADLLDVEVSEEDVDAETRRFRVERQLTADAALADWIRRNDLTEAEFRAFIRNQAVARVLHRWLPSQAPLMLTTRYVLDELRHAGLYEATARQAAAQERVLAEHFPHSMESDIPELETRQLLVDHMRATACRPGTSFGEWAEEVGFHHEGTMRGELIRARLARQFAAGVSATVAAALGGAPAGA